MKLTPQVLVLAAAVALSAGAIRWATAQTAPQTAPQTPAAAGAAAQPSAAQPSAAQQLVGKSAPAFSLPDQNEKTRALADNKGKWVVLAFYPADMTRGCTLQNKSYSAAANQFAPKNAVVYTVSTQDTKSKQEFCSKEGLAHTLLSDVGGKTAQAYGVLQPSGVARRVTFYIAPDGTVAKVDEKINVTQAAQDSLDTLAQLEKPAPKSSDAPPAATTTTRTRVGFAGPASTKVAMGEPVADFGLPNAATGKTEALSTLAAGKKATVVMFVSTQCPVSNAYNGRMAQIASQYTPKNVAVIAINANQTEPASAVAAHAQQHNFSFPVLKDENNQIADRFEARVTPEVYVMDDKGVLVYHGSIDDSQNPSGVSQSYLSTALDAVLAGQPVPVKTTKAFGCTIKRAAK